MRFLFTTTAGMGHLQPLLPLARASMEAGHQVAFACPSSFRTTIEALGMGTFAAGRDGEDDPEFREGVPQVLVPMGADQLDNTARAAAAGTARVLTIEGLRPEVVREAVREVLSDPGYRSHARRLQAEMEVLPPVEYGVALLEGLATGSASAGPIPDAHSHESTDEGARAR